MKAFEKRVADLEKGTRHLPKPGGRTASEKLTAERYVRLMIQGRRIPATLRKQHAKLPPEETTPAVLAMYDKVNEEMEKIKMEIGDKEDQASRRKWKEKRGL